MKIRSILVLIVFASLLFVHCSEDNEPKETGDKQLSKNDLRGNWEVNAAMRDGDRTRTLDNTVFRFTDDSMFTNLPTQQEPATYAWEGNDLIRHSKDITIYNVHTLNKDSLEFSVILRGSNFRMYLTKEKDTQEIRED